MKLKIIYRYIVAEILKIFFVIMCGIMLFIMISNLIDEIPSMLRFKPSFIHLFNYFLYKMPFLAAESAPFAILLSILYVFSQFNRYGELNAMKSAGIDFYSIVKPVLALSLVISVSAMALNETVVSRASEKATYIKEVLIEKRSGVPTGEVRMDLAKLASGGRVFYIRVFDGLLGTMKGVCVLTLDKNFNLLERLDAKEGNWKDNKWVLKDITVRTFAAGMAKEQKQLKEFILDTKDTPADFTVRKKSADDILTVNIVRLNKLIRLLKDSGFDYKEEETNLHLKIAFPFASFILALLGVSLPFLFTTTRSLVNAALGFLSTVVVSFFYMGFVTIGLSLGKVGVMPPMLAAWAANIIFAAVGFAILWKIRR